MKSLLLNLLESNPDTFEEILKEKKIRFSRENNLMIMNYDVDADFHDPVVQEARGIIIDTEAKRVVCWPFRKFGNIQEDYADKINWKTARVEEKIDGSIIKLWYYENAWRWSTNACINAEKAMASPEISFMNIIEAAENLKEINFSKLNHDYTYIFELTSPYNRVVIKYPNISLWHIGTRSCVDGEELFTDIGVKKPKTYPLRSVEQCMNAAKRLNPGIVKKEGFVVVDNDWNRVKIKSPEYIAAHRCINNGKIRKDEAIRLIMDAPDDAEKLASLSDMINVQFKYYEFKIAEFKYEIGEYISYVRNLYEEYSHQRKAVAEEIKGDRFATFGFLAIGNDKTVGEILEKDNYHSLIIKNIDEYKRPYYKTFI